MKRLAAVATIAAALVLATPASSIVFGELDEDRHPNVGALIVEFEGEKRILCSGALIAPRVFLTASHCTAFVDTLEVTDVWVTFDPTFDDASPLIHGTHHTHPEFGFSGQGGFSDPHDIAVVVLDSAPAGVTPAMLPTRNQLDSVGLKTQRFVAVGYGTVRETKTKGPHGLFFDGVRRSQSKARTRSRRVG